MGTKNLTLVSIVIVLDQPDFMPCNPFVLIEGGLFTREEIQKGPMDFGPGYALRSGRGYTVVKEINRYQISFDSDKSNDFSFIIRVVDLILKCFNPAKIAALGINFSMKTTKRLNAHFLEFEQSAGTDLFGNASCVSGYMFSISESGYQRNVTIKQKTDATRTEGVAVSENNHFIFPEGGDVLSIVGNIQMLKGKFEKLAERMFQ